MSDGGYKKRMGKIEKKTVVQGRRSTTLSEVGGEDFVGKVTFESTPVWGGRRIRVDPCGAKQTTGAVSGHWRLRWHLCVGGTSVAEAE
jgi:hypothetical protein